MAVGKPEVRTVMCPIAIPQCVLGAEDCDVSLRPSPSPRPTLEECDALRSIPRIEFRVPAGSEAGCILHMRLKGDVDVEVPLPEGVEPGDTASLVQRPDGTWRLVPRAARFAFVLPECSAEDVLSLQVPDYTTLSFSVPEGVAMGDLIALERREGAWCLDKVYQLPDVENMPRSSEIVSGPYAAALELIKERGYFQRLPLDSKGVLQVSVPFCGRFQEHALLGDCLAKGCLSLPGVSGARILGTEFLDKYYYEWAIAQKWCKDVHPQIDMRLRVRDLTEDPLPEVGLTIALHPEVTKGGCWFQIVASIVRSSRDGLCVFATFFHDEVQTLLNMLEMYRTEGSSVEVVENPYYDTHPMPEVGSPRMRYLVLVFGLAMSRRDEREGDDGAFCA